MVLTTKHHDGFRLWPSKVENPRRPGSNLSASRDLVGDLTSAVRSTACAWDCTTRADWTGHSQANPFARRGTIPDGSPKRRIRTLCGRTLDRTNGSVSARSDVERHQLPEAGNIPGIFAHYYNTVQDGVINNRFGVEFSDFTTPEYAKYDRITEKKWESCRGLGFSFGYNQAEGPEQVIAPDKLIALLVDIVSKNGNLLLNVGPRSDGSISEIQLDRLHKLGDWLAVNGEGIFDTKPWVKASASDPGAPDVRFTHKANNVYAYLLERPTGASFIIPGVLAAENTRVRILGADADSEWKQKGRDLEVTARLVPSGAYALGVRITPEPWQVVKS